MSPDALAARGMRCTPLEWTPLTAYALGLAATDGNLGRDGRHVQFGSSDRELVQHFVRSVGRPDANIRLEKGRLYYRAQLSDRALHEFLTRAGLTPNKSLTLARLDFPDRLFWDVTRGLLDGDGSIRSYIHNPIKKTYPGYRYERLEVVFHTASRAHAEWVQDQLRCRGLDSALLTTVRRTPAEYAGRLMFKVKVGKHASIELLANVYRDRDARSLKRKRSIWDEFVARYSDADARDRVRPTGADGRSFAAVARALELQVDEVS
jgi:hypothetical protein